MLNEPVLVLDSDLPGNDELQESPIEIDYTIFSDHSINLKQQHNIIALPTIDNKIYLVKKSFNENLSLLVSFQERLGKTYNKEFMFEFLADEKIKQIYSNAIKFQDSIIQKRTNGHSSKSLELLKQLVQNAYDLNATDVHLVIKSGLSVHYRIDKKLASNHTERFTLDVGTRLFNAAMNTSRGDDIEFNEEQSKTFEINIIDENKKERQLKVRAEKAPIDSDTNQFSQALYIRIVRSEAPKTLEELYVDPPVINVIKNNMQKPKGLILVTGPTGSGKTSLLGGAVHYFPKFKHLRTIEDPVELNFDEVGPYIEQSTVDKSRWDKSLASLLRQDPDGILLGEIRTLSQVNTCLEAARTGHLVMSTLHTTSAIGTIDRLIEMGIELTDITTDDTLSLLIATKLAPKTCPACALKSHELPKEVQDQLKLLHIKDSDISSVRFANCYGPQGKPIPGEWNNHSEDTTCPNHCNSGIKGIVGVTEFLEITNKVRNKINSLRGTTGLREWLVDNGWMPIEEVAKFKVLQGLLDPFEIRSEIVDLFDVKIESTDFNSVYGDFYKRK